MQLKKVYINIMESIALFLGYIMSLHHYESSPAGTLPPHPQIKLYGDNISVNKWFRTFSTNSMMATNALRMFAKYMKYSPVSPVSAYVPGVENTKGDDLSRVYQLFPNKILLFIMFHIIYYSIRFVKNTTRCQNTTFSSRTQRLSPTSLIWCIPITQRWFQREKRT